MKIITIDDHSITCRTQRINNTDQQWFSNNKPPLNYFVFQYEYRFGCVIYCNCLNCGDHLDFKLSLLNSISPNKSKLDKHRHEKKVKKGGVLKDILTTRDISLLHKFPVTEFHYLYTDNAGKEYALITNINYSNYLPLSLKYNHNFFKAERTVEKTKLILDCMKQPILNQLWGLYSINKSPDVDDLTDIQIMNLTDLLNKNNLKSII